MSVDEEKTQKLSRNAIEDLTRLARLLTGKIPRSLVIDALLQVSIILMRDEGIPDHDIADQLIEVVNRVRRQTRD